MDTDCLKKELARCLGCRVKPCEKACPLGVSPHDFIKAAKENDYAAASKIIASKNPLPQTCGLICPDKFCQHACIRKKIDSAIQIPCLQAEIMRRGGYPPLELPQKKQSEDKSVKLHPEAAARGKFCFNVADVPQDREAYIEVRDPVEDGLPSANQFTKFTRAAVVGGGAAGLGAAYELILNGWHVDLYEKGNALGGAMRLIPEYRLPKEILDFEIARITENDRITVHLNTEITGFNALKSRYDGVILALGETTPRTLGIKGEEHCIPYAEFLTNPAITGLPSEDTTTKLHPAAAARGKFCFNVADVPQGKGMYINVHGLTDEGLPSANQFAKFTRAAVVGGGEVALDCALSAAKAGCQKVEMFVRRRQSDMRIQANEYQELSAAGITIRELTSITEITCPGSAPYCLKTIKNKINADGKAEPRPNTDCLLEGYDIIIQALGSYFPKDRLPEGFILAGDMTKESGTAVEALASGRAAARKLILKENQ